MTLSNYPPTDDHLKTTYLRYLRECRPKVLQAAQSAGELDELVALAVNGAKTFARNLMLSGVFEPDAWNRAIRSELLESDSE